MQENWELLFSLHTSQAQDEDWPLAVMKEAKASV